MVCANIVDTVEFDTYAIYPDNKEEYIGTFPFSKKLGDELVGKTSYSSYVDGSLGCLYGTGYVMAMYKGIYKTFDVGPNGFIVRWERDKEHIEGVIYWRYDAWRIKRKI